MFPHTRVRARRSRLSGSKNIRNGQETTGEDEAICFEEFRLDVRRRRLWRGAELVEVTPKALEILLVLIRNRDRIVTRSELMSEVWPDVVVEEANLTQNVSVLRKALGERAGEPELVVTVPGQGYRFVGDPSDPNGMPIGPMSETEIFWKRIALASMAGIVVLGLSAMLLSRSWRGSAGKPQIASIAVLPFQNGWGNPASNEGVSLADSVIRRLAATGAIAVRPTADVLEFSDPRRDTPAAAGRQLGVDAVVAGALVRRDDGARLSVELVRSRDATVVWSSVVDAPDGSVASIAKRLSTELVSYLGVASNGTKRPREE